MGETREEISQALRDLHAAGCELITITQYLRPSLRHHPVERWVKPEEFVELRDEADEIGFAGVMSGPLVRSSYRAGRLYQQAIAARDGQSVRRSERVRHHGDRTQAQRRHQTAKKKTPDPKKPGRIKQIAQTYRITKKTDPRIGLILLGVVPGRRRSGSAVLLLPAGAAVLVVLHRPRRAVRPARRR